MLPVTGVKTDDRELALCLAQPSKMEPFLLLLENSEVWVVR